MSKEISKIFDSKDLKSSRETLKSFVPQTKTEAMEVLAFMSVISNPSVSKNIKTACYNKLEENTPNIQELYDDTLDITAEKYEYKVKVYDSDKIRDLEEEISYLKDKLKELKETEPYEEVVKSTFWKLK